MLNHITKKMKKVLLFATHPIQYQAPLFRLLAKEVNLIVVYAFQPKPKNQADAGFGVAFEWDIPLLDGYIYEFAELENKNPNTKERKGLVLKDPQKLIEKHKPDVMVVHGWFPYAMLQMIKAGAKLNVPVWVRGDSNLQMKEAKLKTFFKKWYFKWLFSKIYGFLYVGSLNKALYQQHGVEEQQLVFSPHSIDTDRFTQVFEQYHLASKKKQFVIGFAGKFIIRKNPFELIEAIAQLKIKKQIFIKWIGDGPLKAEIEKACKKHNINYEITGFLNQSEIVKIGYNSLNLLVIPSKTETWGLVVNEVYCGNIPVISSDKVGCAPNLVETVHPKLVYPAGQANRLAESIDFAIENYTSLCEKVKEVSVKYSIQNTLKGYLKAIQQTK